ncbi:peptidylprolyl isomerase [Thiothrix litoralis]|jgi:peptidyl-prolyl cis-trans isomerase C|uniref:peptidylprolyl isomerase n=1 Tax=Thiothrix litoralis TaxID=2891210 RepID=A0ABX7WR18_9GAMM|nr:peptidylprolyl isomerase [Thiothrix litoralis]QTR46329.1 peptidylprolyl isomerase [Thiothrix litoralis]
MENIQVGKHEVTEEAIASELQYHPAEQMEAAWQAAATSLVIKTLLEQRATELGITAATEEERTALLLEQELIVPEPTEEQCQHYFHSNRARFHTPVLLAVSHILLPAAPDDMPQRDQQRILAAQLLRQLQADPGSFAALAQQYSACPSSGQGGSLGQLSKGQTVAEFERQVWLLPVGLCANPVETRFGFHLVRVDQRVEGEPLEYQHVATRIRQYLHEQVTRRALSQYLQVLGAEIGVEGIAFNAAGSPLMQ